MSHINSVFFDFDGVLIDSKPAMEVAWKSVQEEFSIKNSFSEYKKYIGLPFKNILMKLNINEELMHHVSNHYFLKTSQNNKLINLNPYVHEILNWLKSRNIKTGIVTSKDQIRTYELVELFNLNLDIIVTPELTERGKPNADPILYAIKILKSNRENSLFIGDMKSDMLCAKNSNCKYLHYMDGYGLDELVSYGGVIYSIYEIKEYLLNF